MDYLGYVILNIILITLMFCSFMFLKFKNSKLSLMFPIATLTVSLAMFFAYVYGLYGIEHTDGIPVTFFMRLFMLDDNVNQDNIQTGFITSLLLVAFCILYLIVFVYKYRLKSKNK